MTDLTHEKRSEGWWPSDFAIAVQASIARLLAPKSTEADLLKQDLELIVENPRVETSHPLYKIPFIHRN